MGSLVRIELNRPSIILIVGVAGTGKTSLSKEILRQINAFYLDNNFIADAFYPGTRHGRRYQSLRPGFYRILYRIAEENLKLGNSVLLDVPHIKEAQKSQWRKHIRELAARSNATMVVVRCHCPEKLLRERIRLRGELRDGWKLANWSRFLAQQPPKVRIPLPHLNIDTSRDLSENVRSVIQYIRRGAKAVDIRP